MQRAAVGSILLLFLTATMAGCVDQVAQNRAQIPLHVGPVEAAIDGNHPPIVDLRIGPSLGENPETMTLHYAIYDIDGDRVSFTLNTSQGGQRGGEQGPINGFTNVTKSIGIPMYPREPLLYELTATDGTHTRTASVAWNLTRQYTFDESQLLERGCSECSSEDLHGNWRGADACEGNLLDDSMRCTTFTFGQGQAGTFAELAGADDDAMPVGGQFFGVCDGTAAPIETWRASAQGMQRGQIPSGAVCIVAWFAEDDASGPLQFRIWN